MPFDKLCPLLGSMLQKHKSINHTQTYSEKLCIASHNPGRIHKRERTMSVEPDTGDTPLSNTGLLEQKRKRNVSFLSEIQNHSFSDHHPCCIMLVFQPVWTLSVSDCAVNSPPLPLPLTLTEEIMSFQLNLNRAPHFL